MTRNVGNIDRVARSIAVLPLIACSFLAPLPLATRIIAFAVPAAYMLFTALKGTCLGYRLMGKSTCPASEAQGAR
jgi:hypothetical protein